MNSRNGAGRYANSKLPWLSHNFKMPGAFLSDSHTGSPSSSAKRSSPSPFKVPGTFITESSSGPTPISVKTSSPSPLGVKSKQPNPKPVRPAHHAQVAASGSDSPTAVPPKRRSIQSRNQRAKTFPTPNATGAHNRHDDAQSDQEAILHHPADWPGHLDVERDADSIRRQRGHGRSKRDRMHWKNFRHRHQPVARHWQTARKRVTATIACVNTAVLGFIIGVYAGEVPALQYQLVDQNHIIPLGNVSLYLGLAISTFIFWPLPLLHGRKPYTLGALALALPLQFPQAVIVSSQRPPDNTPFYFGLMLSRGVTGLVLGFANINFITTLFDLFGASLQSSNPHGEIAVFADIRRQGGGMGLWLGIWSWCFIGSLGLGFLAGAGIIGATNPAWGFYVTVILLAFVLLLNVVAPETRRAAYRLTVAEILDSKNHVRQKVVRGEVKVHISEDGPQSCYDEVAAGITLSGMMFRQRGFLLTAVYLAWVYAHIVLIIMLLGALLSREYRFRPIYVGLGVFSISIGALLAIPLAKANMFSRSRSRGPRTDSMTYHEQLTWTSHLVRRIVFMTLLPVAGMLHTVVSIGRAMPYIVPIIFAGVIGFLSNLAIAETYGIIMETYDTSDLQPGVNSKHRLQSLDPNVARRRTNYSSFPRVTAGIFLSQALSFALAAAASGVGGALTRRLGAQTATGVTAGILLFLTALLTAALWRYREVQVIPHGARKDTVVPAERAQVPPEEYWKAVIIGNPSGKYRRMNLLELGAMSRWTEIQRLNRLVE